jgi:hypothetical protein
MLINYNLLYYIQVHFFCEYIYFTWKTAKNLLSLILSERRLQIHVEPTYHENTPMMKILTGHSIYRATAEDTLFQNDKIITKQPVTIVVQKT